MKIVDNIMHIGVYSTHQVEYETWRVIRVINKGVYFAGSERLSCVISRREAEPNLVSAEREVEDYEKENRKSDVGNSDGSESVSGLRIR